ncbi:permease-like cell division protein FtsX [Veillonella magna]|jgi:cell division transport system permease protein|uniref:Cell division protein FtsX n=1 Tax=Veillonella magna TaxID=464322 RepID=A0ABS2GH81_9FIRM|nr:permease-like cell division protein FtsX [Veillonella magna]MBD8975784.1 ABC transporter permease [Veillonella magna]MBM6824210.1 ABC transporter permease [Veillonella magna]MBM6912503.1 ABC transporter permease [Veillonella magna]
MKLRTFGYYIKEALKSMRRNGLMTLASISTVALSLFILGVFTCGVMNLNNLASNLENQVEISVYLKDGLTTQQIMGVGKKLKAMPDLKNLEWVNKEEAMKRFKERLGDQAQLVDALNGNNPLPNSYILTFKNPEEVKNAAKLVSTFPEVESAHYGQDVIEQIFKVTQVIRIGGIALIVFLAGATLFIISNTIRLTVFARRKEIAIMKYVGATNWFIRWPFLIEGMMLGFVGAAIATACVWEFYHFVTVEVEQSLAFLPLIPMLPFFYNLTGILLGLGIVIGAIGSTISLKQYMKV